MDNRQRTGFNPSRGKIQDLTDQPNLQWLSDLDRLTEKKQKNKLAHEAGAGAKCLNCEDCPGLELHFWRKCCKVCKCSRDVHDVEVDDEIRFDILLKDKATRPVNSKVNVNGKKVFSLPVRNTSRPNEISSITFDWIPPQLDENMVLEYMNELPAERRPVSGTDGGVYRQRQWDHQIPLHDISFAARKSKPTVTEFDKFMKKLTDKVVGQAEVLRVNGEGTLLAASQDYSRLNPQTTSALNPSPFYKLRKTEKGLVGPIGPNNEVPSPNTALANLPQHISHNDLKLPRHFLKPTVRQNLFPESDSELPPPPLPSTSPPLLPPPPPLVDNLPADFNNQCGLGQVASIQDIANANPSSTAPREENANEQLKMIPCEFCKLDITPGTLAVHVKKGKNQQFWHPACFVCTTCKELLVDLIYFYHTGSVYCLRHYAEKAKISRCHTCDELLFDQFTRADDKDYHVEHFCCFNCDEPLADKDYVDLNEQPWCMPCYLTVQAKECLVCHLKIQPDQKRVMVENLYCHNNPECFKCCVCSRDLLHAPQVLLSQPLGVLFCSPNCKHSFNTSRNS